MSDTPKFEVIDRRKFKADHEESDPRPEADSGAHSRPEGSSGPRLVNNDAQTNRASSGADAAAALPATADGEEKEGDESAGQQAGELPPAPTAAESAQQKTAYDGASQRLEDLIRAQDPAAGPQPPVTFESLIQQFYLSAMIQMGAGTQEGQRPRVDILGARTTIDLLGVLAEKSRGNLTESEDRMLQSVLFECRMAFMELTSMITLKGVPPAAPPPPGKR